MDLARPAPIARGRGTGRPRSSGVTDRLTSMPRISREGPPSSGTRVMVSILVFAATCRPSGAIAQDEEHRCRAFAASTRPRRSATGWTARPAAREPRTIIPPRGEGIQHRGRTRRAPRSSVLDSPGPIGTTLSPPVSVTMRADLPSGEMSTACSRGHSNGIAPVPAKVGGGRVRRPRSGCSAAASGRRLRAPRRTSCRRRSRPVPPGCRAGAPSLPIGRRNGGTGRGRRELCRRGRGRPPSGRRAAADPRGPRRTRPGRPCSRLR